jgi:hypothetical protein
MKGKPTAKLNRRAAGLPIRAALDPRPDSGSNPASDIFRAVKAEQENTEIKPEVQTSAQIIPTIEDDNFTEATRNDAEIVPGTALIRFGGGQMRVVSLQPPRSRKVQKKPRKVLKVITNAKEVEKIPQLFERTKAEELYDLLFQLTLGAEVPCNSVRVRRSDLMSHTNIKTRLTLDLNLKRLEENGLIAVESRPGEQEGNIYTVFPLPQSE